MAILTDFLLNLDRKYEGQSCSWSSVFGVVTGSAVALYVIICELPAFIVLSVAWYFYFLILISVIAIVYFPFIWIEPAKDKLDRAFQPFLNFADAALESLGIAEWYVCVEPLVEPSLAS